MKRSAIVLGIGLTFSTVFLATGIAKPGTFSATATVETRTGTRSMPFNLVVTSPMTMEEAEPLKDVLAKGGQHALLNAIRGAGRGKIQLGGFEYPVDLVVVEPGSGGGLRYYVVTSRAMSYDEVNEGTSSTTHPFSVFVVNVPSFGMGDGRIYPRAALSIDEEGHVRAEHYEGRAGTIKDVKRLK
jgi:hypothetical protein